MDAVAHGPASISALRDAVQKGREPPPAEIVAQLPSYWLFVIGTVCIGAFMGQVDSSIAQLLLPRLELEFDARLSTVSWVAVAYLLAMAAFLPIFGRLADMMGRKLLYTAGFLLFLLSSALCGLAPSLPVLIAFRVLQGIGAALLSSNSVAIVVAAAGPERRGRALGILSAAQAIGLSTGPAIGGPWCWISWTGDGCSGSMCRSASPAPSWDGSCSRPPRTCRRRVASTGRARSSLRPRSQPWWRC
jgi:MFS family permease